MTTLHTDRFTCAVCGTESEHTIVASTNQFGSPDLDLRPPEMARSTIAFWVQECPNCGYVAADISDATKLDPSLLTTERYLSFDGMPFGDDRQATLAKRFYKQYILAEDVEDDREALSALMHAAWVCDDDGNDEAGSLCRSKAAEKATALIEHGPSDRDGLQMMRADLLRRSGNFDDAIRTCSVLSFSDETLEKVRMFELMKAQEGDMSCHTVAEAVESA